MCRRFASPNQQAASAWRISAESTSATSGLSSAIPHQSSPGFKIRCVSLTRQMLDHAAAGDAGGWFRTAASIGNQLRVCGLAATYTMLHAMGPAQGRLLYLQAGDRPGANLLRELRQHGISLVRRSYDTGRGPRCNQRLNRRSHQTEIDRPPCPAPARIRHEVADYDARSETRRWDGPDYRMTYRSLGDGPPLFVVPGIASTYHVYALLLNQLSTRFRTIIYDYPGEHADDGAKLRRITHDSLVEHLFGLIDHLNIGRAFLAGISFGSTVVLKALDREPRRFPRAVVQGAFAHRRVFCAERLALSLGRLVPGKARAASASPPDLDLQRQAGVPRDPGGPLAVLSREERRHADPIAGTSRRPAHPARPSPDPGRYQNRASADSGA